MAGHSKWANIKHKKGREDAKRGKIWSKCSKAIMVAAKNGGPDTDTNLALRYAVDEAKSANMPKDNIKRAIEKGAGLSSGGADYVDVRYEGYGPCGVAVIVDCLTDNRNRTAGDVRMIFSKSGGNLGTANSVAFMFEMRGILSVEAGKATEDQLMELALEAGADDVAEEEGGFTVTTSVESYLDVKGAIEEAGIELADSELTMVPSNDAEVAGDDVSKILRLIDALEDHDDVQKVYTNMSASEEDLAAAG